MFRKLFQRKPRLDAADPNDRAAAVAALADDEQAAFARIFQDDADRRVRLAALARLADPQPMLDALADAEVAEAATARLLAIVDEHTPASIREHPDLLRASLAYAQDKDSALAAAPRISDVARRAAALADNARAEVRRAVAEEIWAPDFLAELAKSMRGRDKIVHRLASERLAALKQANAQRCREDAETDQLAAAAEALADDDPHYEARRDTLDRKWQEHLDALAATDQQLAPFGVVARDLNAIRGRFPVRRQPPKAVEADVSENFQPLLAEALTLAEDIAAAMASNASAESLAERATKAEALTSAWRSLAEASPPSEAQSVRFDERMALFRARLGMAERNASLLAEADQLLDRPLADVATAAVEALPSMQQNVRRQQAALARLLERYEWPEDLSPSPPLAAYEERRSALAGTQERIAARLAELADAAAAGIADLKSRIESGAVHEAVESDHRLQQLIRQLPPDLARPLSAELADVGKQLRELRDWRDFAEAPKRQALCEQMEELAAEPLPVHEQSEAVRALRQQWKELGFVDDRKGRDLRKRFDRAAERAFEPCRQHFKEQAERRAFNLSQRQAIVAALEGYLADNDWQQPDWRGVDKVLRQARAEWRQYLPVDRRAGRDLAKRFEEIAEELHGRLKEEWERNIKRKEELVEEAVGVRESGWPATEKANALKDLQRRWREVGPLPRQADQRLWKLFRAECDAVFEARNAVRDQRAKRRRVIEDAENLINELERRVDLDPGLDRNTVADYEQRLADLDSLPSELRRRAEAVLRHADRALIGRQARQDDSGVAR